MIKSKIFKYFLIIFLVTLILLRHSINALSVNIDGLHNGVEWDNATVNQLLNEENNSNVNYGLVKTMIDAEENALYLCFMFIDPSLEQDNTNVGVSLKVENSSSFEVTVTDSPSYSDNSDYSFEGAITVDENNGATCEIRIGFKNGLPEKISAGVRFIDSFGTFSNLYNFSVINSHYSETTELIITEEETIPETEFKTEKNTTKKIKTTKEKTTKLKTTNAKKTTYEYEKTTDYTLKRATTKAEKKTTKFYIQTSPPYSYVRKTKSAKTTKSVKTTVLSKTTKAKPATVYYYEKEVIVSQVYVTEHKSTTAAETVPVTENAESTSTLITASESTSSNVKSSFSLSKGTKYKIIIGVLAAISFTVIAAAGTRSAKKSSDNDETPDSQ